MATSARDRAAASSPEPNTATSPCSDGSATATHEAAIRKLEAELDSGDLSARLAAAEKELDSFDRGEARTRIADLERQIRDVRADDRIEALEKQIQELHADDRIAEIERRLKPIVERPKAQVVRLGS